MNDSIKIVANYLPQFHEIPENNAFWGKGYTDWVAVKNAVSLFPGHVQPKIPINNWYYSLDQFDDVKKQVEMANLYGIAGFNIYHYWFNSDLCLLTRPAEIILCHPELNISYMFTWDNASWKRTWSAVRHANDWAPMSDGKLQGNNHGDGVLAKLDYGNKQDWVAHFEYLLKYFKDERYIKEDNKPLFGLFNPNNEPNILKKMFSCWDELARANGFEGIKIICKNNHGENKISPYSFFYEPSNSAWETRSLLSKIFKQIEKRRTPSPKDHPKIYEYKKIWEVLLKKAKENNDQGSYFGCFVNFDDTARRGNKSHVIVNGSPELFGWYLEKLIRICKEKNKSILFITAWNEWSEGAYLEPDEENKYGYLEAIKRVIDGKYDL